MKNCGMWCRVIARKVGCHHRVITRLKHEPTNDIKDCPRSRRAKTASVREDWNLLRLVRRATITNAPAFRKQCNTNRRHFVQTVRNCHKAANYRAHKRPECLVVLGHHDSGRYFSGALFFISPFFSLLFIAHRNGFRIPTWQLHI